MKKAFTIVELLVAIGLMAVLMIASGQVFSMAADAQRKAKATSEIMQKLQAITEQLNADFKGLRKDGEILIAWVPGTDEDGGGTVDRFERFDRIMFFANGNFQSYNEQPPRDGSSGIVHGNLARICYMLAKDGTGTIPNWQSPEKRILARTQHIYSSDVTLPVFPDITSFNEQDFADFNPICEYDTTTMQEWKDIPASDKEKILSVIAGKIDVGMGTTVPDADRGTTIDVTDPGTIHNLLCEGVGEFSIQGWHDLEDRWVPMLDPDGDGDFSDDTDFFLNGSDIDAENAIGIWYPYRGVDFGGIAFGPGINPAYPQDQLDEAHFNEIPGFGRAFKFSFTLYDSRGVFKDGKKFSHIVYVD